jgi:hypothetical protein
MDPELHEDVLGVPTRGVHAHAEQLGDFGRATPRRQQSRDLDFSAGKPGWTIACCVRASMCASANRPRVNDDGVDAVRGATAAARQQ